MVRRAALIPQIHSIIRDARNVMIIRMAGQCETAEHGHSRPCHSDGALVSLRRLTAQQPRRLAAQHQRTHHSCIVTQ